MSNSVTNTSNVAPGSVNSSNRPATSKPRGICRYYKTERGCYAGDRCKFLHGESERTGITPYDRNKVCRFHEAGYCKRGEKCWFIHVDSNKAGSASSSHAPPENLEEEENCSICYDKPVVYGLLVGCSHVFCLQCIKNWRGSEGKSSDMVEAGTTKTCPMCRVSCRFVTPSSIFFPEGHPRKTEIIEKYKSSMARVRCKYFEQSLLRNKRFCPFGKDCFYKHENPDGTPYIFEHGADHYMGQHRRFRRGPDDFIWEPEDESGFEAMLNTISLVFSNAHMSSRDMQRAVLSSVAAVLGADSLPPMYRLDDESEEEVDGIVSLPVPPSTDQPEVESPRTLQPWQEWPSETVIVSPPPEDASGLEIVDSHFPLYDWSSPAPNSPSSTSGATLDPNSPAFVPSFLDNLRPLPSGPEGEAGRFERLLRGLEDSQRAYDTRAVATTPVPEASSVSQPVDIPDISQTTQRAETAVHDTDPPFMTDGRGRVVWSSTSSSRMRDGRRGRATSSSATVVPHSKSTLDLSTTEESSDETSQHDVSGLRSSTSRRLVRRRSVPIVGLSVDAERSAEFVTDGRGRVVFASHDD